jgi:hypothetical protein
LADEAAGKRVMHDCGNTGLIPISIGNFPGPPASLVQEGVLSQAYAVNGPIPVSDIVDPTKHPECQGWVQIRAYTSGGVDAHGVFNDGLFISITDFGLQKRAAYALSQVLSGIAAKQQQRDLHKATEQAVPKL